MRWLTQLLFIAVAAFWNLCPPWQVVLSASQPDPSDPGGFRRSEVQFHPLWWQNEAPGESHKSLRAAAYGGDHVDGPLLVGGDAILALLGLMARRLYPAEP